MFALADSALSCLRAPFVLPDAVSLSQPGLRYPVQLPNTGKGSIRERERERVRVRVRVRARGPAVSGFISARWSRAIHAPRAVVNVHEARQTSSEAGRG